MQHGDELMYEHAKPDKRPRVRKRYDPGDYLFDFDDGGGDSSSGSMPDKRPRVRKRYDPMTAVVIRRRQAR